MLFISKNTSNDLGSHQTLLTSVPTATLILTTEKILINLIRLIKFILEQWNKTSSLPLGTEKEYLQFVHETIPELRSLLTSRRFHLDRLGTSDHLLSLPVCIYHQYLLNGINFLCYVNKIDGIHSTKRH